MFVGGGGIRIEVPGAEDEMVFGGAGGGIKTWPGIGGKTSPVGNSGAYGIIAFWDTTGFV
jgi:hypothetical protein